MKKDKPCINCRQKKQHSMTPEAPKIILKGDLNENASWEFIFSDITPSSEKTTAVVCIPTDGQKLLIVRHKLRGWELPGGHKEEGETLVQTVAREVEEESGYSIQTPVPFGHQKFTYREPVNEPPYPPYPHPVAYIAYFYGLLTTQAPRHPMSSQEIAGVGLFSLEEACGLLHHWYQKQLINLFVTNKHIF